MLHNLERITALVNKRGAKNGDEDLCIPAEHGPKLKTAPKSPDDTLWAIDVYGDTDGPNIDPPNCADIPSPPREPTPRRAPRSSGALCTHRRPPLSLRTRDEGTRWAVVKVPAGPLRAADLARNGSAGSDRCRQGGSPDGGAPTGAQRAFFIVDVSECALFSTGGLRREKHDDTDDQPSRHRPRNPGAVHSGASSEAKGQMRWKMRSRSR